MTLIHYRCYYCGLIEKSGEVSKGKCPNSPDKRHNWGPYYGKCPECGAELHWGPYVGYYYCDNHHPVLWDNAVI